MQVRVVAIAGMLWIAPVPQLCHAQAPAELYKTCVSKIKEAPQEAYEPCMQYLGKAPQNDVRQVDYVKSWISNYEKVRPYVKFLEGVTTDESSRWFVYGPDMAIPLPSTSDTEGAYKVEISRTFANSDEETMLREAEAVYPNPKWMIEEISRSLVRWASNPPEEMAPIWGMPGNDRLQEDEIVTARAVRYYYDLSLAVKANPHLSTGFDAQQTELKYEGVIKHYDRYVHKKDSFQNVYVADLTLEWSFTCGGLCGMGFTRNKVVVLDTEGRVLAVYLDSPVNSTSWVS